MLFYLLLLSFVSKVISFTPSISLGRVDVPMRVFMVKEAKHRLVLIRHGLSTWNKENLFTGWADVPLAPEGEIEAHAGGKLMKEAGYTFDIAFTSKLKRAIKTLWIGLEELDQM